MQVYSTVTQKGQVTIPKKIRDLVGISIYQKVSLAVDGDSVVLSPQKTILELSPTLLAPKGKNALKARKYTPQNYKPR